MLVPGKVDDVAKTWRAMSLQAHRQQGWYRESSTPVPLQGGSFVLIELSLRGAISAPEQSPC
jgi:hypothetical protein